MRPCTRTHPRACLTLLSCASSRLRSSQLCARPPARCAPQEEVKAAAERGEVMPTVGQDMRLDNRFLDLRTPANQAIFRVQSAVCQVRAALGGRHHPSIHPPVRRGSGGLPPFAGASGTRVQRIALRRGALPAVGGGKPAGMCALCAAGAARRAGAEARTRHLSTPALCGAVSGPGQARPRVIACTCFLTCCAGRLWVRGPPAPPLPFGADLPERAAGSQLPGRWAGGPLVCPGRGRQPVSDPLHTLSCSTTYGAVAQRLAARLDVGLGRDGH